MTISGASSLSTSPRGFSHDHHSFLAITMLIVNHLANSITKHGYGSSFRPLFSTLVFDEGSSGIPGGCILPPALAVQSAWGYAHRTVCHAAGEFARDEDGDGFCEVHVNTIEGFWSLLRSWLRPHRGVSQEKLPLYLGFFEFVHNVRKRGRALPGSLDRPSGRVTAWNPG